MEGVAGDVQISEMKMSIRNTISANVCVGSLITVRLDDQHADDKHVCELVKQLTMGTAN